MRKNKNRLIWTSSRDVFMYGRRADSFRDATRRIDILSSNPVIHNLRTTNLFYVAQKNSLSLHEQYDISKEYNIANK